MCHHLIDHLRRAFWLSRSSSAIKVFLFIADELDFIVRRSSSPYRIHYTIFGGIGSLGDVLALAVRPPTRPFDLVRTRSTSFAGIPSRCLLSHARIYSRSSNVKQKIPRISTFYVLEKWGREGGREGRGEGGREGGNKTLLVGFLAKTTIYFIRN